MQPTVQEKEKDGFTRSVGREGQAKRCWSPSSLSLSFVSHRTRYKGWGNHAFDFLFLAVSPPFYPPHSDKAPALIALATSPVVAQTQTLCCLHHSSAFLDCPPVQIEPSLARPFPTTMADAAAHPPPADAAAAASTSSHALASSSSSSFSSTAPRPSPSTPATLTPTKAAALRLETLHYLVHGHPHPTSSITATATTPHRAALPRLSTLLSSLSALASDATNKPISRLLADWHTYAELLHPLASPSSLSKTQVWDAHQQSAFLLSQQAELHETCRALEAIHTLVSERKLLDGGKHLARALEVNQSSLTQLHQRAQQQAADEAERTQRLLTLVHDWSDYVSLHTHTQQQLSEAKCTIADYLPPSFFPLLHVFRSASTSAPKQNPNNVTDIDAESSLHIARQASLAARERRCRPRTASCGVGGCGCLGWFVGLVFSTNTIPPLPSPAGTTTSPISDSERDEQSRAKQME